MLTLVQRQMPKYLALVGENGDRALLGLLLQADVALGLVRELLTVLRFACARHVSVLISVYLFALPDSDHRNGTKYQCNFESVSAIISS
jgi:hypothetical protein